MKSGNVKAEGKAKSSSCCDRQDQLGPQVFDSNATAPEVEVCEKPDPARDERKASGPEEGDRGSDENEVDADLESPNPRLELVAIRQAELAKRLGVSPRHIKRLEAAGKLPPSRKLGRCRVYPITGPVGVAAWIDAGMPDRATLLQLAAGKRLMQSRMGAG